MSNSCVTAASQKRAPGKIGSVTYCFTLGLHVGQGRIRRLNVQSVLNLFQYLEARLRDKIDGGPTLPSDPNALSLGNAVKRSL